MYIDPGVYATIRDESEYAVLGGATVFSVVGTATKGDVDTPIYCYGEQDLINKVGLPNTTLPDYAVQAAIQYLQRGSTVIFVRVADGTELEATVTIDDFPLNSTDTLIFTAVSPGTWGNSTDVVIELEGSTEYSEVVGQGDGIVTAFDSVPLGLNNLLALTTPPIHPNTVQITTIDTAGLTVVFTDDGLGVLSDGGAGTGTIDYELGEYTLVFAVAPANTEDIVATYRSVQYDETFTSPVAKTVWNESLAGNPLLSFDNTQKIQPNTVYVMESDAAGGMTTIGVDDGAGAIAGTNITSGTIDYDTGAVALTLTAGATQLVICYRDPFFNVAVEAPVDRHGTIAEVERFASVVMDTGSPRYVVDVVNDGVIGEMSASLYVEASEPVSPSGYQPMVGTYDLAGGVDGTSAIADADYIGTYAGGVASGLQILENPESVVFDILAVPGVTSGAVVAAGIVICEDRKDCIYVVDAPMSLTVSGVLDWHNGVGYSHAAFNSPYACLMWSWVKIYDSYNRAEIWIPASGFAAAQMAYTDSQGYPWYAPAGTNRGVLLNALEVEYSPTRTQRDQLYGYPNAVNSLVDFQTSGIVIWGQKTLYRANTARNRINVMRMIMYVQRSVTQSVELLVFEQNNEFLWARFKALVRPILEGVKSAGGLESYDVICDSTTNPAYVRDQLEMHARIILVPVKTAEKIVIEFVVRSSSSGT